MKCLSEHAQADLRRFRLKYDNGIAEMVLTRIWGEYKAIGAYVTLVTI